jgi:hypothetical protein
MKRLPKKTASKVKAAAFSKAKRVAPAVPIHVGSTPATKYRGDSAIFGRLVEDHDRHRALFSMIEAKEATHSQRGKLFRELVHEIKGHAAAEEQALWSTVLRHPESTDAGRHAVAEHKKIDDLFADLAARNMKLKGWLRLFGEAKKFYLHHVREEEQEQFVESEKILTRADQRHMHRVFDRRKREEKASAKIERKIRLK